EPRLAASPVIPKFGVLAERIVADVDVGVKSVDCVRTVRIGTQRLGIAEGTELAHVAGAAMGAGNAHGCSVQVRLRTGAAFVDDIAASETVEPKLACGRMRLVACDEMGEAE